MASTGDHGIVIRLLRSDDDRRAFCSGHPDLDRYFRDYAGQHSRRGLARIEVADCGGLVKGYSASVPGQITTDELPLDLARRLPRYPLPILRLGRLAVALGQQRRGIGRLLLRSVLERALRLRAEYGCVGVVVDAKPGTVGYYTAFGFTALPTVAGRLVGEAGSTATMFLPMGTVAKGLGGAPRE